MQREDNDGVIMEIGAKGKTTYLVRYLQLDFEKVMPREQFERMVEWGLFKRQ